MTHSHPSIIVEASVQFVGGDVQRVKQVRLVGEQKAKPQGPELDIERKAREAREDAEHLRKLLSIARRIRTNSDVHAQIEAIALSPEDRLACVKQLEEQYFDARLRAENLELHADYQRDQQNQKLNFSVSPGEP